MADGSSASQKPVPRKVIWELPIAASLDSGAMKPSLDEMEILRQDFNRFDADSSGYIQGAELGQLLALQLGRQPTEHEQQTALEDHDCNRDGQISFEEYVAWLYPTTPDNKGGGSSFVYKPGFLEGGNDVMATKLTLNQAM